MERAKCRSKQPESGWHHAGQGACSKMSSCAEPNNARGPKNKVGGMGGGKQWAWSRQRSPCQTLLGSEERAKPAHGQHLTGGRMIETEAGTWLGAAHGYWCPGGYNEPDPVCPGARGAMTSLAQQGRVERVGATPKKGEEKERTERGRSRKGGGRPYGPHTVQSKGWQGLC